MTVPEGICSESLLRSTRCSCNVYMVRLSVKGKADPSTSLDAFYTNKSFAPQAQAAAIRLWSSFLSSFCRSEHPPTNC